MTEKSPETPSAAAAPSPPSLHRGREGEREGGRERTGERSGEREPPFPITGYVAIVGAFAAILFLGAFTVYWRFPTDAVFVFFLATLLTLFLALAAAGDAIADRLQR